MGSRHPLIIAASLAVTATFSATFSARVSAQVPLRAVATAAIADALSTEPGGFLLAIPGVADDFILFADGQWQLRNDGTVRLSAYVQMASAVDREFFIELIFDGRISPGDANHPPTGSPVTTMLAAAYAPTGPVDPSTFHYFTQVSGTMTGLRAFAGARIDISNVSNTQIGLGATNKNTLAGLAVDLAMTVVQPPTQAVFAPTGPATLRATFVDQLALCATHVDSDPAIGGTTDRLAFDLPGAGDDYLFLPAGSLLEANDGTATLTGTLTRQSDYEDQWQLQLQLAQRVDPNDPNHPPAGLPVQQLLASAYATQGGAIAPEQWRYYTQVTGTLVGMGNNDGALVQLTAVNGVQIGIGAGQGNVFFGLSCELQATLSQPPNSHPLTLTGNATLHANLATSCILPAPIVLTGDAQTTLSVTRTTLTFTGTDLGFVELAAIGPNILGTNDRRWLSGFVRTVDHQTLELSIPQGLPGGGYPLRFLNQTRPSNQLSLTIQEPTALTVQTEPDRLGGEDQHWVTHSGTIPSPAISLICLSSSNQPSVLPGTVTLLLGSQFQDLLLLAAIVQDPTSKLSVFTLPSLSANLVGLRAYSQVAVMAIPTFPLLPSNLTFTDY